MPSMDHLPETCCRECGNGAEAGSLEGGSRRLDFANHNVDSHFSENIRQSEFLAMILHELRNPLHGIEFGIHVLRTSGDEGSGPDWLLKGLEESIRKAQSLVEDLMEVCWSVHPSFRLRTRPIDLVSAAEAIVERRRVKFVQKGLRLQMELPAGPAWIEADVNRLDLALGNLLDNSAKYTPSGGDVVVSISVEDSEAIVSVQDTGVGVAPETLPLIFEPFVRETGPHCQTIPGSGIGLLLVRTLVELHGGHVDAFSLGRGQGSTFVMRFPSLAGNEDGRTAARSLHEACLP